MASLKYPKNEIIWVHYYNQERSLIFIITSKATRDYYYLYELVSGEFKKLGKASSPTELEERYKIRERIGLL